MSNKPLNISEEAAVQMPMKTVASLIIVALGTMGYFQIIERLKVGTRYKYGEGSEEYDLYKMATGQLGFPRFRTIYDDRGSL